MSRKTLSLVLLISALASLVLSHLVVFSWILPGSTRLVWQAHDVFQKNQKEAVGEDAYNRALVFWLRDSTTIVEWARSLHAIFQIGSGVLFVAAFAAAYKKPIQISEGNKQEEKQ